MSIRFTALALAIVAGVALAGPDASAYVEKPVWTTDTAGNWVPIPIGNPGARARCWTDLVYYRDSCNKEVWELELKHEASVAQWIVLGMTGDGFHWGVRKPGYYASDCLILWFRSNYDVDVEFGGFENLLTLYPDSCIDDTIEVWYAFTDNDSVPPPIGSNLWMTPSRMNEQGFRVYDSYRLHWEGWMKHIWTMIHVSPCNSACEYVDPDWANIEVTLTRIKPWIDPETGLFDGMPNFPFQ